jgi:hypothetical protein
MNTRGRRVHGFLKMAALIAMGALLGEQSSGSSGDVQFQAVSPDGCRRSSWTPEVFSFYGDPEKVMDKLSRFDMKLADRRIFMYMVESADAADLVLYERPLTDSGPWTVWRWSGKPSEASKIREDETNQILARQGKECVGAETKKLLEHWKPQKTTTSSPPTTASAAFGGVISGYRDSYIRASMFLLC